MVRLDRKERCGPVTTLAIKQASSSPLVGSAYLRRTEGIFLPTYYYPVEGAGHTKASLKRSHDMELEQ